MTSGSNGLFSALAHLNREAEAMLDGNNYYLAAQKLLELKEVLGLPMGVAGAAADKPLIGVQPAIQALRVKFGEELTDNRYYLAAHKLDIIAYIAERAEAVKPAKGVPEKAAAPQPVTAKSFDDLAQEAQARVASVMTAADAVTPAPEPRSSEPCMAHEALEQPPSGSGKLSRPDAETPAAPSSPGILAGFIRSVFGRKNRA